MNTEERLYPQQWAERTFGRAQFHDMRRTRRAVKAAAQMARDASASLPQQMQTCKDVKAVSRVLDEADVSFEALMQPHWQQTSQRSEALPAVLLVQDTTEIDVSHHPKTEGLGQLGNKAGRGLYLQTVLALDAKTHEVVGWRWQEPFIRTPAPKGETRTQRRQRKKATDVWQRTVEAIGHSPSSTLVHLGDRGADLFAFLHTCGNTQTPFVVRAAQDRRVQTADEHLEHLVELVGALPSQDQRPLQVPTGHGRQARTTSVPVSFTPLRVLPPRHDARLHKLAPLPVWVIRIGEPDAPEDEEPLEWIVLTSCETVSCEQAWQRVDWYRERWKVEQYHQGLKTGCRLEQRQVRTAERLMRLLGLLSPLALRLLQLRDAARRTPERPAHEVREPAAVAILAARAAVAPEELTSEACWKAVAGLGGYLGRKSDGLPGWRTLWKGWLSLQTLLEGVQLASQLRL